jgi:predicted nucleic acid-binding protein
MTVVIDASVAAKWVLPEIGSERAAKLRERGEDCIAPSLLVAEIGSAVWKRARREELTVAQATSAIELATALMTRLVPLDDLATRAVEFAIRLDHTIYDCFYLALAAREDVALITADRRLLAKASEANLKAFAL